MKTAIGFVLIAAFTALAECSTLPTGPTLCWGGICLAVHLGGHSRLDGR